MQTDDKIKYMTNEESYTQRRMLFKNIWDTAMNIDGKDDIMSKPKVIKTLHLDEVDKCVVGKTKKQRIKNLRHVCNRILDFCDRQDADDVFYEQFTSDKPVHKIGLKIPKKKTYRGKKKMKAVKSMFVPKGTKHMKATVTIRKSVRVKALRKPSPVPGKWTTKSMAKIAKKNSPSKGNTGTNDKVSTSHNSDNNQNSISPDRKPVKKNPSQRKKPSDSTVQATGIMKSKNAPRRPSISQNGYLARPIPQLPKLMIN